MSVCRLSILSLSLLLSFELLVGPPAGATEVWLGPQSPKRAVDFLDMFTPDAPWKQAASHVNVFKLYEGYLISAPQDQVDKIVADLNRRHIPIALEGGLMDVGEGSANPPPPCGGWGRVEGYTRVINNLHRRAKAFGFVLQPMEVTPGPAVAVS
jgi:hypothetical protein